MPASYQLDPALRLVRSRAWGVLTDAESQAHYVGLAGDPAFDPTFHQLCDLRDVIEIDMSAGAIRRLAKASTFAPGVRRAFVAADDTHFGLSRMLQAFCEFEGTEIGVFRTVSEAAQWLGLETDVFG